MHFFFLRIYHRNSSLKLMGTKQHVWAEREGSKNSLLGNENWI